MRAASAAVGGSGLGLGGAGGSASAIGFARPPALLAAIDRLWLGQRMHWTSCLGLAMVALGTVTIHLDGPT
jgi:multidrug transporter EmrE-like cation transporter